MGNRERSNWGLALLMRPTKAVPDPPSANLPLREHPDDCVGDCRGLSGLVVSFALLTGGISANVKQTIREFVRRRRCLPENIFLSLASAFGELADLVHRYAILPPCKLLITHDFNASTC